MVRIKICGVTNKNDALWITNLGADYIGLNFWKGSKRKISVKLASEIIKEMPAFIEAVGVFVDEEPKNILKIAHRCGLKIIQLHGDENIETCNFLRANNLKVIKAFRIKNEEDISKIKDYIGNVDFILLDTYVESAPGGTGETFNWDLAVKTKEFGIDIFLAGGLTPENVKEAISKVKPYAVDVASGVEKSPRRKDYQKLKEFIYNAKHIA